MLSENNIENNFLEKTLLQNVCYWKGNIFAGTSFVLLLLETFFLDKSLHFQKLQKCKVKL